MHILVSGGTGFIGRVLIDSLVRDCHRLTVLTRSKNVALLPAREGIRYIPWNGREITEDPVSLGAVDGLVNLAGVSLAGGRWTASRKAAIVNSRKDATGAIRRFAAVLAPRPAVMVSASGVGYYGSVPEGEVHEEHPAGHDFLAGVCKVWEEEARALSVLGMRVVCLRFGVVLGPSGGALERMVLPFRLGAGGSLGSGKQWFPWIHLDDAVGLISFALENAAVTGPLNATAPELVTSQVFARTLGRVLGRPSWANVPAPVLRAALGEMSDMLLTGQNASPARAISLGYAFRHPTLVGALKDILG
jgi:uncharacterized protein (TIGR01777 family)